MVVMGQSNLVTLKHHFVTFVPGLVRHRCNNRVKVAIGF